MLGSVTDVILDMEALFRLWPGAFVELVGHWAFAIAKIDTAETRVYSLLV